MSIHATGTRLAVVLWTIPVERIVMVHVNDALGKPPRDIEDADRVLPLEGVIHLMELVGGLTRRRYRARGISRHSIRATRRPIPWR